MYRIIASESKDIRGTVGGSTKASGAFGSTRAVHATPRRYKKLSTAIVRAMERGKGYYEIMDDYRNISAVVMDGKIVHKTAQVA